MSVELLARLNPTTVKFDTGKGGTVELTAQDIAGAIAFVPEGLGREVLLAQGWPEGMSKGRLMEEALNLACAELNRQRDAATTAGLRIALANWESNGKRRQVSVPETICTRWPRNTVDRLPYIVSACLVEIIHPRKCPTCKGRKSIMRNDLAVTCDRCGGEGTIPASDNHRAGSLEMDVTTFTRNRWREVYLWMLDRMADEYFEARREFIRALADIGV